MTARFQWRLTEFVRALKKAGAKVDIVSSKRGEVQAFRHFDKAGRVPAGRTCDEIRPADYDALMLPGGALNADVTRTQPNVRTAVVRNRETIEPPRRRESNAASATSALELLRLQQGTEGAERLLFCLGVSASV